DGAEGVRCGSRWVKGLGKEKPATLLKVASAVRLVGDVTKVMAPAQGDKSAVGVAVASLAQMEVYANVDDRRLAEFTPEEIAEVMRQEKTVFGGPGAAQPPHP